MNSQAGLLWICAFAVPFICSRPIKDIQHYLFSVWLFPTLVASWVASDARKRGRAVCYDFDTFVFWVWPVLVPIYLFQTRGVRAFITLLWIVAMFLVYVGESILLSRMLE
jgi:hypothetical protein